jgi:hypothetical protein
MSYRVYGSNTARLVRQLSAVLKGLKSGTERTNKERATRQKEYYTRAGSWPHVMLAWVAASFPYLESLLLAFIVRGKDS